MYPYQHITPVNLLDRLGFKAGDEFNSPDEAAIDWAKTYYGVTDYVLMEQSSVIYSYYATDEYGNNVIRYSYTEPVVGGPYNSDVNIKKIPPTTVAEGLIHSHSMISQFSKEDLKNAEKSGLDSYLVMPSSEGNADVYKYSDEWGTWTESPVAYNNKFRQLSSAEKHFLEEQYKMVWNSHVEMDPHGDGEGQCHIPCAEREWPRKEGTD